MRLNFIKHYFNIFILSYFIILITKFIFLFYLQNNYQEFDLTNLIYAILWGYKFDFAASSIIAFISMWFDFSKKLFATISSILITILLYLQIGDIFYFSESSRHIGYEITDMFTDASSLYMTAYSQHTFLTIATLIISFLLFIITFSKFYVIDVVIFDRYYILKKIFLIALTIFFIRGMFQGVPLNPWQSNQIGNNNLASLSLNVTYNVIYTLVKKNKKLQISKIPNISEKDIYTSFSNLYPKKITNTDFPILKSKPNLVFLFLESWSAKYLKPYGYKYDATPYFNETLENSIRPSVMISGGHRTTEGVFTTLTSFQNPLGKSVSKTQLQSFEYTSIIDILNKDGYSSGFFQGSSKETSGTGSFVQTLGFNLSFGKKDIEKRKYEENYWGVYDQDLYNFVNSKIGSQLKEPFVVGINGATTHDDRIPQGIEKINFTDNEKLNNQLNALHFSDLALKEFMENTKIKFPNTVFVIFADHAGGNITGNMENYMIPFAIYAKDILTPKYHNIIMSQRDIAPTIYDLVIGDYVKDNLPFSGKSIFKDEKYFTDYYRNGILGWIEEDKLIEINTVTNKLQCYKLENLEKQTVICDNSFNTLKDNALSFTTISQKLLFSGNTQDFIKYRNTNEQ